SALNYGALGSLIGHEFSHALDEFGKEFDKSNLRRLAKSDVSKYKSRINCLKEHYNSYNIDGQQTMVENIADNVGLELSFRAYRRNKRLSRLEDQQFFISYAHMWCEILGSGDEFL
ncbi:Peptidase, partial [Oryctes borbonicus]